MTISPQPKANLSPHLSLGRLKLLQYHKGKLIELMEQNARGIEDLLRAKNMAKLAKDEGSHPAFGNDREFIVGQWVDIRDTTGAWLEGQVIGVEPTRASIHYNGWGARWDEWVEKGSPRLATFRCHTVQSPAKPFLSPYPQVDADTSLSASTSTFEDLLERYRILLTIICSNNK